MFYKTLQDLASDWFSDMICFSSFLLKYLLAIQLFSLSFIARKRTRTFEEHMEIRVNYTFTSNINTQS